MSVSVNVMTRGPADRVAAMLALFRPVVDEIFVAIDDRADESLDRALANVADRLVRYPYAEPVDRPLAWIHHECSGDWVLTVDDDEIPSRALLDALPHLARDRSVTHYWLRRRWLYPDADRYIDAQPWRQDFQLRLVLNDPRVISFPEVTHVPVVAQGPSRYLELPLYHADCVVNSRDARARKSRHYEQLRPGLRIVGKPLNDAFYLPEDVGPATLQVPADDFELIAEVLVPLTPREAHADVRAATREEIDRLWAGRAVAEGDYAARLSFVHDPPPLRAGAAEKTFVVVENLGGATWPWSGGRGPELRIAHRWVAADGTDAGEGPRAGLPADLLPGEVQIVPVTLVAPASPGRYDLVLDLVHEHVRWLGVELRTPVDVGAGRRTAVLDPGTDEALADALATLDPEEDPLVVSPRADEVRRTYAGEVAALPAGDEWRAVLAGVSRAVVPDDLVRRDRRRPLLALVAAARSLHVPVATTAGAPLTRAAVLRRRAG